MKLESPAFYAWGVSNPLPLILTKIAAASLQWEASVVEFNEEEDHVHLLIDYNPKVQISKFVNNLKNS